jgi:hypothetical protein
MRLVETENLKKALLLPIEAIEKAWDAYGE